MGMQADLITRLNADAAIVAITGAAIQWYEFGRGDTGGQITLNVVSSGRDWDIAAPTWLDRPRVRFDLRHTDPATLWTLRAAVLAEMEGSGTFGTTIFHPAQLEAERTIDWGEQEGGQSLYQLQLEFMFYYEESH